MLSPSVARPERQGGLGSRARRVIGLGRPDADKKSSVPAPVQVFRHPGRGYLTKPELCARYGITRQKLEGLRIRSRGPLPDPVAFAGRPHWCIFQLTPWEVAIATRAHVIIDAALVRTVIAMLDRAG